MGVALLVAPRRTLLIAAAAALTTATTAAPSNTTNGPALPTKSSRGGNLVVTVGAGNQLEYQVDDAAPLNFSLGSLQNYPDASLAAFKSGISTGVNIYIFEPRHPKCSLARVLLVLEYY